ncbi:MAG: hypothetical protein NC907_03150 [Candidatus Omnitrophica bacterium]|nr:hypothetical protein [Candidatus Omnitrophota bacterium]
MKEKKDKLTVLTDYIAKEKEPLSEKRNIKCRVCFIVDGYTQHEKKCKHCGSRLFDIDRY